MMPGRGSYGPGGKWIHDRAHRIMEESPGTPKSVAYATATQQGHKVGKSPKGFRTPEGVAMAKAKFDRPKKEYQKTAMLAGFFDELAKIAGPAFEQALQAGGGQMTDAAYAAGRNEWLKQQAAKKALAPRAAAYQASLGRVAKKPATGLLSRVARLIH